MHAIIILLSSSLVSFVGSLQLGPVNLFVVDTTLNESKKSAYLVAFGGVIPESIYCALAVFSGSYFLNKPVVFFVFKIILIVTLATLGTIYLLKKTKPVILNRQQNSAVFSKSKHFFKGFTLASFNPQLLPFWLFILVYFKSTKLLELTSNLDKLAFILGAAVGAFFLLISIIATINQFKTRILTYLNNKYYFKALGIMFIAISLQQVVTLL